MSKVYIVKTTYGETYDLSAHHEVTTDLHLILFDVYHREIQRFPLYHVKEWYVREDGEHSP